VTAVGQSPAEAMRIYKEAKQVLLAEAVAAREESRLPI
jgi:predicted RNase H-like HicB family nuclease